MEIAVTSKLNLNPSPSPPPPLLVNMGNSANFSGI